jgi:hypothetical protein
MNASPVLRSSSSRRAAFVSRSARARACSDSNSFCVFFSAARSRSLVPSAAKSTWSLAAKIAWSE